ncbi:MAG: tetratricopeptide repeat protein [Deltaproteobacteria bacterium]|nr:tetratricopeptide repeat protein [Myxococcales bacterium]MDP3217977.1 tetratricopeptide repeat protein [Deltaproteobacteria bacterium]
MSARAAALLLSLVAGCHAHATTAAEPTARAASTGERTPGGREAGAREQGDGARSRPMSAAQRRYEEGMTAAGRHDWTVAAAAFSDAYDLEPSAELAFNTGRMYEHLADFERAGEWYQRVLSGTPSPAVRAQVTTRLAAVQRDAQRRRDGIAQASPDDDALNAEASVWFNRGLLFFRRHRWREALRAFETANQFVQTAGTNVAELMFNLGVTHERLGHRAEAEAAFRSYLASRPESPDRAEIEQRIQRLRRDR